MRFYAGDQKAIKGIRRVYNLSKSLVDKVKIFQLAKGAKTLDEAIEALLKNGLESNSEHLKESIKREMGQL